MPTATVCNPRRELARRVSGGIEVTLYWSAHDNSTSVEIWQPEPEETLTFTVGGDRALGHEAGSVAAPVATAVPGWI